MAKKPTKPPLLPEEAEAKIRKAAEEGKIVMEDTTEIDDYEDIAREFLMTIFDQDYDECFISDLSSLSDFSSCCIPDDIDETKVSSMELLQDLGSKLMVRKINETYGLDVEPRDYLVKVFERLRQVRIARLN